MKHVSHFLAVIGLEGPTHMYSFAKLPLCQRMLYSQNFDEKNFSMNFDSYFALENKQILTKLYNVLWE